MSAWLVCTVRRDAGRIAAGAGRRGGAGGAAPGRERRGTEDADRVEQGVQAHCLRGNVSCFFNYHSTIRVSINT